MREIGIILNANAKRVRRGKITAESFLAAGEDMIDLQMTSTFEELEAAIRNFKKAAYPYIGIVGGDGTIHHAVTRMINIYGGENVPLVLLLKGGHMDNIATSVGMSGNSVSILKRMLKNLKKGASPETCSRDTIRIEDRYCSLFGIGFVINLLREAYAGKDKGVKQNLVAVFKAVREALLQPDDGRMFKGIQATVTVNGEKVDFTNITAIMAATVEGVGMGFKPMGKALERPNTYHALITGFDGRQMVSHILHIKNGWEITHPLVCDTIADTLTITSDFPFAYTMDGDLYESGGSLALSTGPAIRYVHV
jgi:diacylglycerol kinase family enzyme